MSKPNMRILTFSELLATVWTGVNLAEEFGGGTLKMVHFPTHLRAPHCEVLQILTPSTASSIQAEFKGRAAPGWTHTLRLFVTPVGSLTIPLLEGAVKAARPSQVLMDPDTLAPDLRADCASNCKQAVWMDDSAPPADWAAQMFSELEGV
ncbi:MAG TPA: hypothetical protein VK302_06855 [Terriglobales bacterium]|nr:hypothetical protein [Terriglobales bacterium]